VVRSVPVDQLVGAAEIAQRFGLKRASVVHDWRQRYAEFPLPVATLSAGLVWAWPDVAAWAEATGRTIVENG
jgi:predicted DNA-binding transcriptional regulator AlpA